MPAKLVIRDGPHEETFELHAVSSVLGREPGCDLQFLDGKLSRRHARFEVTPQGVKLTDLGTTNGCFVNGQRIAEILLQHNDKIKLGNLDITFVAEPPHDDATTVLAAPSNVSTVTTIPATPPPTPHEAGTVSLDSQKLQEMSQKASTPVPPSSAPTPSSADGSRTVVFDPHRMQQLSQQPPPTLPAGSSSERPTQMLGGSSGSREGRTVVLAGPVPGQPFSAMPSGVEQHDASLAPVIKEVPRQMISKIRFPSMAWRTKFVLMLTGMLMFLLIVITVPLLLVQDKAMKRISLDKGIALANSLAAKNSYGIITNQQLLLDTDFIAHEPGISLAMVMDNQGKVLSPAARAGERVNSIEGIPVSPSQIRTYYYGMKSSGEYNLVVPIKNDNAQPVGLAWITYDPKGLSESTSSIALVIVLVIFLSVLGGAVMVWAATNMTVKPLAALRDATESVIKGDSRAVEDLAGFAEINALAQSINRLIERGGTSPGAAPGPQAFAPRADYAGQPLPTTAIPSTPTMAATGESGQLVVDGNFSIIRASGQTEKWLGVSAAEIIGRHLIEAIHEQRLLEVLLDLVNALATQPQATQEADFSAIASLGGVFTLSANRSPAGDQTVIQLIKK